MSRATTLFLVLAIALGLAGYFFWVRDGEKPAAKAEAPAAAKQKEKVAPEKPPKAAPEFPTFEREEDPKGDLRLEGLVTNSSDDPVGGVTIAIDSSPRRTTKTGEDGSFFFDELAGRTYAITARKGADVAGPVQHVLSETSEPVMLTLAKGSTLEAAVVNEKDEPIAGAAVTLKGPNQQLETSDADGVARFEGLPSGYAWVIARKKGYAPARELVVAPDGAASALHTRLILRRGAKVSGVVLLPNGKGAAGAKVYPVPASKVLAGLSDDDVSTTSADGSFEFEAIAGGSYRFRADKDDYAPQESEPIYIEGATDGRGGGRDVSGIVIQLAKSSTLKGSVVTSEGAPAPWAQVRVSYASEDGEKTSGGRQVTADGDGRFEIRGLRQSPLLAVAETPQASSAIVEVDLTGDKEITIALSVEGIIAGVVEDSNGEPVADAQIALWPDFWGGDSGGREFQVRGPSNTRTDPGGRFRLTGVPAGKYRVRASRSAATEALLRRPGVSCQPGDENVRIVLDPNGGIRGRLRAEGGEPPTLFTVIPHFPPGIPVTSEDGRFELDSLTPGSYDVTFRGPDFSDTIVRGVVVEPGEIKDLGDIEVERGRTIHGRVVDRRGAPVAEATVVSALQVVGDGKTVSSAFGSGADDMQRVKTATSDEDGYYSLSGVGDTALTLVAEHESHGRSIALHVAGGATDRQADLVLLATAKLHGKVTLGDEPLEGAQVIATNKQGSSNMMNVVVSGKGGAYAFDRLTPGDYQLKAMKASFLGSAKTGSAETTLPAGGDVEANINIIAGDLEITVAIAGQGGVKIDAAQVFLFTGEVDAASGQELHEKFVQSAGGVQMSFSMAGKDVAFKEVAAGPHSLCAVPINGDFSDPTFQKRLQEHRMSLAVHCQNIEVSSSTGQRFKMLVPPMAPFPEDD